MQRIFALLALLSFFTIIQTVPAYCSGRVITLVVSATLPQHLMSSDIRQAPMANNDLQIVQTQTVIRNNRAINLVSIVVP